MAKDVTIRDVAKLAGVSVSTVSLVVNKRENVSPRTAVRVQHAINRLEYKPVVHKEKYAPRSSRPRRTNRISFFLLGHPRVLLTDSIYSDVVAGAEDALRERGLALVLRCVPEAEEFEREVSRASFDGLLLLGNYPDHSKLTSAWRYPCVKVMGMPDDMPEADHICVDEPITGKLGADYLLSRGHRNCAFLGRGGHPRLALFERRGREFMAHIAKGGGQVRAFTDPDLVELTSEVHVIRHDRLAALVDGLLELDPRPTGLMIDADTLAVAVYQCLLERGVRPGVDLEIVSCNNEKSVIASLNPPPAVVDIHAHEIGKRGVEQVLWRCLNRHASRNVIMVQPTLSVGKSGADLGPNSFLGGVHNSYA